LQIDVVVLAVETVVLDRDDVVVLWVVVALVVLVLVVLVLVVVVTLVLVVLLLVVVVTLVLVVLVLVVLVLVVVVTLVLVVRVVLVVVEEVLEVEVVGTEVVEELDVLVLEEAVVVVNVVAVVTVLASASEPNSLETKLSRYPVARTVTCGSGSQGLIILTSKRSSTINGKSRSRVSIRSSALRCKRAGHVELWLLQTAG
jgi:hypothetical protein